jgi:repressor LexA
MKEIKEQGEKLREAMIDNIVEYIAIHGYPPTVREIGDMVGLKSTATTQHHMKILLKEGKIKKTYLNTLSAWYPKNNK